MTNTPITWVPGAGSMLAKNQFHRTVAEIVDQGSLFPARRYRAYCYKPSRQPIHYFEQWETAVEWIETVI